MSGRDGSDDAAVKPVERVAVWVSLVTAIIAAAGVWISQGQLTEMRLQRNDAKREASAAKARQKILDAQQIIADAAADKRQSDLIKANQDLANAAKTQADSTTTLAGIGRGQLITAQDTAQRQLRAYVFATQNFGFSNPIGQPDAFGFNANWKNGGLTPTRFLSIYVSGAVMPLPIGKDFQFPDLDESGNIVRNPVLVHSLLGPSVEIPSQSIIFSRQKIEFTLSQRAHIYIWGWARYRDIFISDIHITRFCQELTNLSFNKETNAVVGVGSRACDYGNCADDQCKNEGIP
jgi:hypothetical protein